jgi:hypothetical protein
MPKTIDYRIVTATGETHVVTVSNGGAGYLALSSPGMQGDVFSAKNDDAACVARYAGKCNWPVAEIVPPGGETRAELAARVRRETLAKASAAISEHAGSYSWFYADLVDRLAGAQS